MICVIGAGSDEIGEAVQNGGSGFGILRPSPSLTVMRAGGGVITPADQRQHSLPAGVVSCAGIAVNQACSPARRPSDKIVPSRSSAGDFFSSSMRISPGSRSSQVTAAASQSALRAQAPEL
jgi:hypothetical protein